MLFPGYLSDYNASAVPVPVDQNMACLDITIIQDTLFEGAESFNVLIIDLDVACSGNVTVASNSTTVVTIEDDDGRCSL